MNEPTAGPGSAAPTRPNRNATAAADTATVVAQVDSLVRKGELQEAENAILAALLHASKNWEYYIVLGRVYSAQKRPADALEAYRHAALLEPANAKVHFRYGEFLFRRGDLQEAEKEISKAIFLNPRPSEFHAKLGAVLLARGWVAPAHASLKRAIRLNRESPYPREVLAKLLAQKGKYRAAEKSLAKALALAPNSTSALGSLSEILEAQGKTDAAIACTRKILDHDPAHARSHVRISNQYKQAGRLDEAEQAMRAALALKPTAENFDSLSQLLSAQSRTSAAIAALAEACRLDPENWTYRTRLADLASKSDTATGSTGPTEPIVQKDVPAAARKGFQWLRIFGRRRKID